VVAAFVVEILSTAQKVYLLLVALRFAVLVALPTVFPDWQDVWSYQRLVALLEQTELIVELDKHHKAANSLLLLLRADAGNKVSLLLETVSVLLFDLLVGYLSRHRYFHPFI
jgi:hypothetical protein